MSRLEQLNIELNKPDLWDDPHKAGRLSRKHGSLTGKIKAVNEVEATLIEHMDMMELAREENDLDMEAETTKGLLHMRKLANEKEIAALLSAEHDSCSCYLEVINNAFLQVLQTLKRQFLF